MRLLDHAEVAGVRNWLTDLAFGGAACPPLVGVAAHAQPAEALRRARGASYPRAIWSTHTVTARMSGTS